MSQEIIFDSPQDVELVQRQVAQNATGVVMTRWFEETEDVVDENGDKVDYKYRIHIHVAGSRVPLKSLLYNDQTRLKEILDGSDTAANKKELVVKEAIQAGSGVGYNI